MIHPLLNNSTYKLILGSQSPRRKELLTQAGFNFEVRAKSVEEIYPKTYSVVNVPSYLANLKSDAMLADLANDEILLTADTVVILNEKILGKPANREEAIQMLKDLSDTCHTVLTGIVLRTKNEKVTYTEETKVTFYQLNSSEINFYVDTYKPYDKAGAYGIQEFIGCIGIKKIEGSHYNVMGLPIDKVYFHLKDLLKLVNKNS